jgi:hypothetical protein
MPRAPRFIDVSVLLAPGVPIYPAPARVVLKR